MVSQLQHPSMPGYLVMGNHQTYMPSGKLSKLVDSILQELQLNINCFSTIGIKKY